jgi:Bacterial Ig-like domain (group 3)
MDELTLFHELTLFREFRSDTPGPSAAETEAARARLLDAIAGQGCAAARSARQRRWPWLGRVARPRFWAPVAAAVAVMAVVIAALLLAVPGSTATPKPKPAVHPRHHVVHHPHGGSRQDRGGTASGAGGKHAGTGASGSASPGVGAPAAGAGGAAPGSGGTPGAAGSATPTTTDLTVSTGELSPGQTMTLTARVTPEAGDVSGGTVSFYVDAGQNDVYPASSETVCASVQLSNGVATCSYTPQDAQTDAFFAAYSGSQKFQSSESVSADATVLASTTTALAISSTQVSPGQTVTMTATVTDQAGDDLSGATVSFYVVVGQNGVYSGALEPVCTDVELTYNSAAHDNVATCSYTPESTQTDQLSAQYAGYGEYAESGSGVNLTVT